jgi:hypothetical protein
LPAIVEQHQKEVLAEWLNNQMSSGAWRSGRIQESQLRDESQRFLALFTKAVQSGVEFDTRSTQWADIREFLTELSRSRAQQGFAPSQVATFVFSLKQALFKRATDSLKSEPEAVAGALWEATVALDALGLYTTEVFQQAREQLIARQQEELIELSTPVVQLWEGVLALPLIGTLDSERTQVVMESLLERLVATGLYPAIDIEASISRLMPLITSPEHQQLIRRFRQLNAVYGQNRDLITIGAYAKGSDPRVDEAIQYWPGILKFLQQDGNASISFAQSVETLRALFRPERREGAP